MQATPVGAPVTATDIGADGSQEVLTYTMNDATPNSGDAALFTINRQTGQITVRAGTTLDYEDDANTDDEYVVTVAATDPLGNATPDTDDDEEVSITVTIEVTDVDEDPTITEGSTSITYNENNDDSISGVTTYVAEDDEDDDNSGDDKMITWKLSGRDGSKFEISDDGVLTIKSTPDFEAQSVYNFSVVVTDSDGNTDSRIVTVTIKNVEEPGTVVLLFADVRTETLMLQPKVGTKIRAKLNDPDNPSDVKWQWTRNNNNIDGATSATYTPDSDEDPNITDVGAPLKAIATYTDIEGSSIDPKPESAATPAVQMDDKDNVRPVFSYESPIEVPEPLEKPTEDFDIGATPVTTDDDRNALSYTLSVNDRGYAGVFKIDGTNGQISVKAGTVLDYETKKTYTVTVSATDPSKNTGTTTVTINVTKRGGSPVHHQYSR